MTEAPDVGPDDPTIVVYPDGSWTRVFDIPHDLTPPPPVRSPWQRHRWQLAPAAITVLAVLWPASTADTITELVVAVGLTAWIWWRGR